VGHIRGWEWLWGRTFKVCLRFWISMGFGLKSCIKGLVEIKEVGIILEKGKE